MRPFGIRAMATCVLLVTACSSGDAGTVVTTITGESATENSVAEDPTATVSTTSASSEETTTSLDTAAGGTAGEIPDPCDLVPPEDLGSILGEDPGSGTVESLGENQRQICSYGSGLVIFVDHVSNWAGDASLGLIQNPSVAVSGVGEEAYWQDIGGPSQLVALGSGYFIGVMVPSGGQPTAEQVAVAVLSALDNA